MKQSNVSGLFTQLSLSDFSKLDVNAKNGGV